MPASRSHRPFARLEWDRAPQSAEPPAELVCWSETRPCGSERLSAAAAADRLIQGDNLAVMQALLPEWEGRIDLIYADPPFFTGKAFPARVGRGEDSRRPEAWQTAEGYEDAWRDGSDYLNMLYPRLRLMHRLLAPTGTLYLHLDWHAAPYARLMLDEIFGPERLLNEIIWIYHGPSPIRSAFKRKHDTILAYTKTSDYVFDAEAVRVPYDASTVATFRSSPRAGFGKVPDLRRGKVPEDWWYFPVVARLHRERTGFPTQKPEALLERILRASSRPGDTVADFFCGSGTTAVVAARLGRRWLAVDRVPLAVHTTYRRLLLSEAPPFSAWGTGRMAERESGTSVVEPDHAGREIEIRLKGLRSTEGDPLDFPETVDLWEVDWDYDGTIFRSASQSVREWRSERLGLSLKCASAASGARRIAVRAFDRFGRMFRSELALPLS